MLPTLSIHTLKFGQIQISYIIWLHCRDGKSLFNSEKLRPSILSIAVEWLPKQLYNIINHHHVVT